MSELTPQLLEMATNTLIALAEEDPEVKLTAYERRMRTYVTTWKKHNSETRERLEKNSKKVIRLDSLCKTTHSVILVEVLKNTRKCYLDYQTKLEDALKKGETRERFYDVLHQTVLGEIRDQHDA